MAVREPSWRKAALEITTLFRKDREVHYFLCSSTAKAGSHFHSAQEYTALCCTLPGYVWQVFRQPAVWTSHSSVSAGWCPKALPDAGITVLYTIPRVLSAPIVDWAALLSRNVCELSNCSRQEVICNGKLTASATSARKGNAQFGWEKHGWPGAGVGETQITNYITLVCIFVCALLI